MGLRGRGRGCLPSSLPCCCLHLSPLSPLPPCRGPTDVVKTVVFAKGKACGGPLQVRVYGEGYEGSGMQE
jgi:hypothetical protein